MRWRYHGEELPLQKIIADVENAVLDGFASGAEVTRGVHNPLPECMELQLVTAKESYLIVSHYVGTAEQYFFRNDCHRSSIAASMQNEVGYDKAAAMNTVEDDSHRLL